jgi:hypothetical protein
VRAPILEERLDSFSVEAIHASPGDAAKRHYDPTGA